MKKTLQKKFVLTAMVAITALLLILLGAINGMQCWVVRQQADRMLTLLCQREGGQPPGLPGPALFFPPINDDTKMAARFFVVYLGQEGQVTRTDVSRIASVTEAQAAEYASQTQGRVQGRVDRFRFRTADDGAGGETKVVFLDTSADTRAILSVLVLSVAIGGLCWAGMLIFVMVLSRKAIQPIAQNIERQKQFVTNAGHEIKTPLAIIQANTDAMELHVGESKWSRNIRAQTVRLHGLMQNLLTLARIDEESQLPPAQEVDLGGVVQEAVDAFQEAAALRHILLKWTAPQELHLWTNREHMLQLLSILLDNAVKYTAPGGRIGLSLEGTGDGLCLQVRNAPAQLPEGDVSRIFDRFYRGDAARTQKSGGYGIGLSAAQAIVQAWKGTLTVQTEQPDTVVFTLRF